MYMTHSHYKYITHVLHIYYIQICTYVSVKTLRHDDVAEIPLHTQIVMQNMKKKKLRRDDVAEIPLGHLWVDFENENGDVDARYEEY